MQHLDPTQASPSAVAPPAPETPVRPEPLASAARARLAHLFRHSGDAADDRFLLELLTHYREQTPP